MIIRVTGVLRRTVVRDWCFDSLYTTLTDNLTKRLTILLHAKQLLQEPLKEEHKSFARLTRQFDRRNQALENNFF